MNECFVYYDLLANGFEIQWFSALSLLGGSVSGLAFILLRYFKRPMTSSMRLTFVGQAFFLPALAVATLIMTYGNFAELAERYRQGAYHVVSGTVSNFDVSTPRTGDERFTVDGVEFFYSDYAASAGFRKTRASGGPLREGLPVRIRYIGNAIVRLEICDL